MCVFEQDVSTCVTSSLSSDFTDLIHRGDVVGPRLLDLLHVLGQDVVDRGLKIEPERMVNDQEPRGRVFRFFLLT